MIRLVRLPGAGQRAVHLVPSYSARTLCGMTADDVTRMDSVPTGAGYTCRHCRYEVEALGWVTWRLAPRSAGHALDVEVGQ